MQELLTDHHGISEGKHNNRNDTYPTARQVKYVGIVRCRITGAWQQDGQEKYVPKVTGQFLQINFLTEIRVKMTKISLLIQLLLTIKYQKKQ